MNHLSKISRRNITSTVTVIQGKLEGMFNEATGVHSFKGIPYAQSIEGRNRFAPPRPMKPWSDVREAVRYANSSPQQAEDPTGSLPVTPAFEPPSYVEPGDNCLALFNQKYGKCLLCCIFCSYGARRSGSYHYNVVPVFHFITSIAPTGQMRSHIPHEMHIVSSTSNQVSISSIAPLGQTPTQVPQYPHLYLFTLTLINSPVKFNGKLRV